MNIESFVRFLDDARQAAPWLGSLGVKDPIRAHAELVELARSGITLDLLADLAGRLEEQLPKLSDPDLALTSLVRFVAASRSPLAVATLFERDREALPTLLQLCSTSAYLGEMLIRDPEAFDLVRMTEGQPVAREMLVNEVCREVTALADDAAVLTTLRRYKQRETLRIAYGDIIRRQPIDLVTRQISYLADAICEASYRVTLQQQIAERGAPRRPDGRPARFVVVALGKLGGCELNYSSDVDLLFISDGPGQTDGRRSVSNDEFFDRLARHMVRQIQDPHELGMAYNVDLRLRPDGRQGRTVIGLEAALHYYDVFGRTWERQAFVKARVIAGDASLGAEFLEQLEPWVYRRYLSSADIAGIKHLKRRIEHLSALEGHETRDVKMGKGGIRDIETAIQFLQLLNGGDLPKIRTGNTLEAIARLEQEGCLTWQERSILEENYAFLRRIEHRLQIMFDMQARVLPEPDDELRKVALRLGYADAPERTALAAFRQDYEQKTELNQKILRHLLEDAFSDDDQSAPEVDLMLDPDPSAEAIRGVLGRFRFERVDDAYRNLAGLATERISFLSPRRCRHFLAAITPRLLEAVASTPDPDATLSELNRVSEPLGGKGILWELFSQNPPTMHVYVRLCATSPYLANILTTNPGMIDELMDSLVLDKLPTLADLETTLADLSRGAEDLGPILHSFKHAQHLRVGVRDILGKADIRDTHRALSDVAEVCVQQIAWREYLRLVEKYGEPTMGAGPREGAPCDFVILALGKLGGREPNYHSDLDVVFLYEGGGMTQQRHRGRRDSSTTNQHFFSQLAQRIIKVVGHGPQGALYDFDSRLRPTGASGSLAVSHAELLKFFQEGHATLADRQTLCKSRVIYGSQNARDGAMRAVAQAMFSRAWSPAWVREMRARRANLEETAATANLKRGPGGSLDVEFLVQLLQLQHGRERPEVLRPGTLEALAALRDAGVLAADDADSLGRGYRFLRTIESRLRLMNTPARHDFPDDPHVLDKLAYLLHTPSREALADECRAITSENRRRFERLCDEVSGGVLQS